MPPGSLRRRIAARPLAWSAAAVPVALVVVMGWRLRWTDDDGFINFRILDQLFAGHGPVFNSGQRVEAYTSPLWLALLAVLRLLLGRLVDQAWLAVGLGIAAMAGGLVAAAAGAARLRRRSGARGPLWPFGLVVIAALPPTWEYATAGLETGLAVGWVGLAFWAAARELDGAEAGRPRHRSVLVLVGLGPLVRPELALHSAALLVALGLGLRPSRRQAITGLGWALAAPIAYQVFRMGYFATVVPNTALAKAAGNLRVGQGWFYLSNTVEPYRLAVPLLAAAVWVAASRSGPDPVDDPGAEGDPPGDPVAAGAAGRSDRSTAPVSAAVVAAGILQLAYVVAIGGDYMHARLLLVPIFTLCCPIAVVELRPSGAARLAQAGALVAVVAWAVVVAGFLRAPDPTSYGARAVADQRPFFVELSGSGNPVTLDDWRRSYLYGEGTLARRRHAAGADVLLSVVPDAPYPPPPGELPTVAGSGTWLFLSGIGVTGARAGVDVPVIDIHGLADPLAARLPLGARTGLPGHERWLPLPWAEAEARVRADRAAPGSAEAERALRCGAVGRLRRATGDDLTPGRFLANLWDAPSLTWLEVPREPADALARC